MNMRMKLVTIILLFEGDDEEKSYKKIEKKEYSKKKDPYFE